MQGADEGDTTTIQQTLPEAAEQLEAVAAVTDDAVAVIVSTGGVIDYCFLSDAMKSLPELKWLRKGSPLPGGTVYVMPAP